MKIYINILLLIISVLFVNAQIKQMTDFERVGMADLIISGSIQKVVGSGKTGVMIIKTEKVIKGKAGETVDIQNIIWLRGKAKEYFCEGKEFIFFLQNIREGYTLQHGLASIYPVTNLEKIVNVVKNYPLTATVVEPLGTLTIGKRTPVTITFKNNTDKPIGISTIDLEGFYVAKEMDATMGYTVGPEINGNHVAIWQVETIEPGKEYTVKLEFAVELPLAWKEKQPKPGIEAEVKVRFKVTVDLETPRKRDADTYYMSTKLISTKVIMGELKQNKEEENKEKLNVEKDNIEIKKN